MGTAAGAPEAELFERISKCVFCSVDFVADGDELESAKFLECFHSVCGTCVDLWPNNVSKKCPECNFSSCKANLLEAKIIQERMTHKNENVCCGHHPLKEAVRWCPDCQQLVCPECIANHKTLKATQHHVMKPIEASVSTTWKLFRCPKHPQELLRIFCFTCGKLKCRDCQFTKTNISHKVAFVESIVDDEKTKINEFKKTLGHQLIEVNESRKIYADAQNKMKNDYITIQRQINKEAEMLFNQIERRKIKALKNLDKKYKQKESEFNNIRSKYDHRFKILNHSVQFASAVLTDLSDKAIFHCLKSLKKWLEEVQIRKMQHRFLPNPNFELVYNSNVENIKKHIGALGSVSCNKIETDPVIEENSGFDLTPLSPPASIETANEMSENENIGDEEMAIEGADYQEVIVNLVSPEPCEMVDVGHEELHNQESSKIEVTENCAPETEMAPEPIPHPVETLAEKEKPREKIPDVLPCLVEASVPEMQKNIPVDKEQRILESSGHHLAEDSATSEKMIQKEIPETSSIPHLVDASPVENENDMPLNLIRVPETIVPRLVQASAVETEKICAVVRLPELSAQDVEEELRPRITVRNLSALQAPLSEPSTSATSVKNTWYPPLQICPTHFNNKSVLVQLEQQLERNFGSGARHTNILQSQGSHRQQPYHKGCNQGNPKDHIPPLCIGVPQIPTRRTLPRLIRSKQHIPTTASPSPSISRVYTDQFKKKLLHQYVPSAEETLAMQRNVHFTPINTIQTPISSSLPITTMVNAQPTTSQSGSIQFTNAAQNPNSVLLLQGQLQSHTMRQPDRYTIQPTAQTPMAQVDSACEVNLPSDTIQTPISSSLPFTTMVNAQPTTSQSSSMQFTNAAHNPNSVLLLQGQLQSHTMRQPDRYTIQPTAQTPMAQVDSACEVNLPSDTIQTPISSSLPFTTMVNAQPTTSQSSSMQFTNAAHNPNSVLLLQGQLQSHTMRQPDRYTIQPTAQIPMAQVDSPCEVNPPSDTIQTAISSSLPYTTMVNAQPSTSQCSSIQFTNTANNPNTFLLLQGQSLQSHTMRPNGCTIQPTAQTPIAQVDSPQEELRTPSISISPLTTSSTPVIDFVESAITSYMTDTTATLTTSVQSNNTALISTPSTSADEFRVTIEPIQTSNNATQAISTPSISADEFRVTIEPMQTSISTRTSEISTPEATAPLSQSPTVVQTLSEHNYHHRNHRKDKMKESSQLGQTPHSSRPSEKIVPKASEDRNLESMKVNGKSKSLSLLTESPRENQVPSSKSTETLRTPELPSAKKRRANKSAEKNHKNHSRSRSSSSEYKEKTSPIKKSRSSNSKILPYLLEDLFETPSKDSNKKVHKSKEKSSSDSSKKTTSKVNPILVKIPLDMKLNNEKNKKEDKKENNNNIEKEHSKTTSSNQIVPSCEICLHSQSDLKCKSCSRAYHTKCLRFGFVNQHSRTHRRSNDFRDLNGCILCEGIEKLRVVDSKMDDLSRKVCVRVFLEILVHPKCRKFFSANDGYEQKKEITRKFEKDKFKQGIIEFVSDLKKLFVNCNVKGEKNESKEILLVCTQVLKRFLPDNCLNIFKININ